MNSPASQLYLKSTSSMSLHDRFTSLVKKSQSELTDIGANMQQQTASLKNQRLAQQMANWPSVLAALQKIPSMKQRLGKRSIKARLNRPLMKGGVRDMGRHWGRPKGRGALFRGALSMRCMKGLQGVVSGLVTHEGLTHQQHGSHINRPGVMQKRGVRGCLRGNGLATGGRGEFLGRGCGGGRYRAESRPVPTREQLDEQLDDYMSMTKSHLDAQLDAYMAEVD
ncbi:chromatin target of PRMT1b [Pygocentrus nattereri]|uniref:chromatin target of PRMT1b n=1 Tax=Pygocentrus nattereri TaxID=42514 RepID=UPI00081426F6|nr:chromatin target of PRMT1b [Pygocentrus nattereri]XP_017568563.1 chromatin target of PRMT1b [Pygocentrus nattereri]XP_017568564.1 chromatin target of PRMT1b [Pygocentrus nattereri]XP_017568565.1 chromatin target of PRMT1b [Pygocentrus nattereri]XP_017568567.1 chromatin target of PRMT1b [Pygocentrus nattereri]XP_017568569.1 chromatin target of PRMT1b [Pygocentrus nattereri]